MSQSVSGVQGSPISRRPSVGQGHGWSHQAEVPLSTPGGPLPSAANTTCGPKHQGLHRGQGFGGRGRSQLQHPPAEPSSFPTLPLTLDCFPQTQARPLLKPLQHPNQPPASEPCRHLACWFPPQQDRGHWPQRLKRRRGWGQSPWERFPQMHRGDPGAATCTAATCRPNVGHRSVSR